MISINDLLKDYTNIKNPNLEKKEVFNVLNKMFGLKINEKTMFFRQTTVVFKVDSVQKNVIFLKKQQIIEIINKVKPERGIKNIQF